MAMPIDMIDGAPLELDEWPPEEGAHSLPPQLPAPVPLPKPPAPLPAVGGKMQHACPCEGCQFPRKRKQKFCEKRTGALNALKQQSKHKGGEAWQSFSEMFKAKDIGSLAAAVVQFQLDSEANPSSGRGYCRPDFDICRWAREVAASRKSKGGTYCEWMELQEYCLWLRRRKNKPREVAEKYWQVKACSCLLE